MKQVYSSTRDGLYKEGNNSDLVFIFAKDNRHGHRLSGVHFSHDADPTGAYVLIEVLDPESTSTYRTIGKHFVTKGGPGPLEFVTAYETPKNTGLKVTLKAGAVNATFELRSYELVGVN